MTYKRAKGKNPCATNKVFVRFPFMQDENAISGQE